MVQITKSEKDYFKRYKEGKEQKTLMYTDASNTLEAGLLPGLKGPGEETVRIGS